MGYASDGFKIVTALAQGGMAFNNGENEAALANLTSAGGSAAFFLSKNYASEKLKTAYKQELWILEISIVVLQLAEVILLGNANEKGEKFKTASKDFELALDSLADAATKVWDADSADEYNQHNADQIARVQFMKELDLQVPGILKTETVQIKKVRSVSAECRVALTAAIPIGYWVLANYGWPACMNFQLAAAAVPMLTAETYYGLLGDYVMDNADAVKALMEQYKDIAATAATALEVLTGGDAAVAVPDAQESTVGTFGSLSVAPATVPAPAVPAAATGRHSQGVYAGVADTDGIGLASADDPVDVPDDSVPPPAEDGPEGVVPPMYTMPTWSQAVDRASTASTQAAKFAEEAAVTVSLVNEVVGTVEQISSMAQSAAQPPPSTEPAEADDMTANNVEGAAAGEGLAEPVPDSTISATGAEPNPAAAERMW